MSNFWADYFASRENAEMRTGEGKDFGCPHCRRILTPFSGKGVRVVTVNDYLSRRDAVWMGGQIYNELGLTVGCINHEGELFGNGPEHKNKNNNEDNLDKERDILGAFPCRS